MVATKTLSEHLSRPVEEIELVSLSSIDWPDSSVGCPQPDRSYLQVITPGHLAVLQHGGVTYRVHMAKGRAFVCERTAAEAAKGKAPVPLLAIPLEHLQTLARMDLARRLGVSVDEITVDRTEPVVWQDAGLGCAQPGQSYKPNPTQGYLLSLSYHGRAHTYHADRYRVLPCPPSESN